MFPVIPKAARWWMVAAILKMSVRDDMGIWVCGGDQIQWENVSDDVIHLTSSPVVGDSRINLSRCG